RQASGAARSLLRHPGACLARAPLLLRPPAGWQAPCGLGRLPASRGADVVSGIALRRNGGGVARRREGPPGCGWQDRAVRGRSDRRHCPYAKPDLGHRELERLSVLRRARPGRLDPVISYSLPWNEEANWVSYSSDDDGNVQ